MASANAVSWAEGACGFGAKERERGSLRCAAVAQSQTSPKGHLHAQSRGPCDLLTQGLEPHLRNLRYIWKDGPSCVQIQHGFAIVLLPPTTLQRQVLRRAAETRASCTSKARHPIYEGSTAKQISHCEDNDKAMTQRRSMRSRNLLEAGQVMLPSHKSLHYNQVALILLIQLYSTL